MQWCFILKESSRKYMTDADKSLTGLKSVLMKIDPCREPRIYWISKDTWYLVDHLVTIIQEGGIQDEPQRLGYCVNISLRSYHMEKAENSRG